MATTEKHAFQAEIGQLLEIVTHSLYTDKEIFVRELISNAADALEKVKFLQTSGQPIVEPELPLTISVTTDETAKTITIADTGVGMTEAELVENLGTIAHSGSKAFLEQLKASKDDAHLIGQFGVGFYSAFMVADKVSVYTRSAHEEGTGLLWTSDGASGYEIEPAEAQSRGTRIVLHLKEEEFAKEYRIESIIKRYSNFVQFPIELNGKAVNTAAGALDEEQERADRRRLRGLLQVRRRTTASRRSTGCTSRPTRRSASARSSSCRRKTTSSSPCRASEPEVHLYCKKVLIQANPKHLFPEWLRFLRGVVDSEDLPLNISRETMQDSALMRKLNDVLTKRVLRWLDDEAKADADKYAAFFAQHGHALKEGVATDWTHREALAKLLRFESSATEAGKLTSLPDYVSRMPEGQTEIYFLLAPTRESAEASPYYEVFKEKKWEVLFLTDPRDEFVMDHLGTFDSKKVVAAEKAEVKLDQPADAQKLSEEEATQLAAFMKETLGDRVNEVRAASASSAAPPSWSTKTPA